MIEQNLFTSKISEELKPLKAIKNILFLTIILLLIFLTSFINYLLFHTISELFSIIIGGTIFLIGWNSRRYIENSFFLVLGVSFLAFGAIDLFHTIAYRGMGIISGENSNIPTQLWISARYIQSFSFLVSFLVIDKKIKAHAVLSLYSVLTIIVFGFIAGGIFPDCFNETTGLTLFKIISEYVIISIGISALIILVKFKKTFALKVYQFLFLAILIFAISEFFFTLYFDVYGVFNLIGHLLKIASSFFIYLAIVETGFRNPIDLLFRKLFRQEKQIEKERDMFLNIFDRMTDKIYIVNQTYDITYANPSFIDEFGEVDNQKCYEYLYENDHPCTHCNFPEILQGKIKRWEWECNRNNRYYDHIDTSIRDGDGKILKLAILRDITDMKEEEQQLKNFVSMVSHELRNPISVLIQTMEMLTKFKSRLNPDDVQELMKIMSKNSTLMRELVEDILVLSRIDDKRIDLEIKEYQINEILNDVVEQLGPLISNKKLQLSLQLNGASILYGDPQKIQQIFRILLDNAIKYSSERSKIEIKVFNKYQGKYNPQNLEGVLVYVSDNGIGISKNDIPHIFKRFYRSEKVSDITGSGLGLAIAKELVKLHQGEIYVESKVDRGSTFYVFLPLKISPNIEDK
ncbi:MAG: conserved membrane protein of unknown function [Promethearchaeota archaeon]|nr:MAG: conserved membrane protein of unknown function [Candidatus Lokiarchaeota archaeon]